EKGHGIVINNRPGHGAMQPHLVLKGCVAKRIAPPWFAVCIDEKAWDQKQAETFDAIRRALRPGKHEIDDIVREVLLGICNEDLGAGKAPASILLPPCPRSDEADIASGLRLGEVHG